MKSIKSIAFALLYYYQLFVAQLLHIIVAKLKIFDSKTNSQKGSSISTLCRIDNNNPIWNCNRTFCAGYNDRLAFELWKKDFTIGNRDEFIGKRMVPMYDVFVNMYGSNLKFDEGCSEELELKIKNKYKKTNMKTKIVFKLYELQYSPNVIEKKTIFFIRHSNNKFNINKQVDNPLDMKEMQQDIQFNKYWRKLYDKNKNKIDNNDNENDNDNDLKDFISAQVIYSSSLCRATQTAILTLLHHKCLTKNGIKFARLLREIKTIDGLRSTSSKQINFAITNILKYKDEISFVNEYSKIITSIKIDSNDCNDNQKWWSIPIDTTKNCNKRFNDLMWYIRYSKQNKIICIGHSLWMKRFLNRYININNISQYSSKKFLQNILNDTSDKMNDLQTECVRVDISFSNSFKKRLEITDVKLIFEKEIK